MTIMELLVSQTDALTNETIVRPMTEDEFAQRNKDIQDEATRKATEQAEAEAKATQKAALLDRLGITEDEAKLLLA
jgi:hypothetical protein